MNHRKIMYIAIIIVCIACVVATVYNQVILKNKPENNETVNTVAEEKSQEELKKDFNQIFNNSINLNGYDTSTVNKFDSSKEIVYTAYENQDAEPDKYEIDICLPVVNVNADEARAFNTITQEVFADKVTEVLNNSQVYTIYNISYTAYINGDILSVVIKSTLKEGASAQRIIVQTYNYNLQTKEEVSIYDAISARNLTTNEVTKKINTEITNAIKEANKIQASGYETYTRDVNSDMYQIDNISTYFIGENGKLYIIFAYGNNSYTSEMDIIEF